MVLNMTFKVKCQIEIFHPRFSNSIFDSNLINMQHWCDVFIGKYNRDWRIECDGSKNVVYFQFVDKNKGNLFALKWV